MAGLSESPGPGRVSLWTASGPGTPLAKPYGPHGSWAAAAWHGRSQTSWPVGSAGERCRPAWSWGWAVPLRVNKNSQSLRSLVIYKHYCYTDRNEMFTLMSVQPENTKAKPSESCLWVLGHPGDATLVSPGAPPVPWPPAQGSGCRNRWVEGVQGTSCVLQLLMGPQEQTWDWWTHADQPWTDRRKLWETTQTLCKQHRLVSTDSR